MDEQTKKRGDSIFVLHLLTPQQLSRSWPRHFGTHDPVGLGATRVVQSTRDQHIHAAGGETMRETWWRPSARLSLDARSVPNTFT